MLITHTLNAEGQRRIYLGGKSSLEYWLEPKSDGASWTFHWEPAVTGQAVDATLARQSAVHLLTQLSQCLNVTPQQLATVAFDTIAALHVVDPFSRRRTSQGRRRMSLEGYIASPPGTKRDR